MPRPCDAPSLVLAVGLALLSGCGSCGGGDSNGKGSPSGAGIGPKGEPLLTNSATLTDLYGPDGGGSPWMIVPKDAR